MKTIKTITAILAIVMVVLITPEQARADGYYGHGGYYNRTGWHGGWRPHHFRPYRAIIVSPPRVAYRPRIVYYAPPPVYTLSAPVYVTYPY